MTTDPTGSPGTATRPAPSPDSGDADAPGAPGVSSRSDGGGVPPAAGGLREWTLPLLLRRVLPGVVLLVACARLLGPVRDPDTFWHIATGDYLRETWRFSGPDPWSTMSTETWRLHEWTPELLMSLAQQWFGLPGVAWLLPLGVAGIGVALWWSVRREAGLVVAAFTMVVALVAMSGSLSLRPHLVTFAFTSVVTGAWLRTVDDGRARWWLIGLSWLWACTHGMWFVGVVVGGVVLVGMWLDGRVRGRRWLRLALVPFGSVVAAALTPVGPGLLLAPLAIRGTTQFVDEWKPPSLSNIGFVALLLLVAVPALTWLRRGVRVPWTRLLLLGVGLGFALLYVRTIPVGAAIAAPVAAGAAHEAVHYVREPVQRAERALLGALTALGLVVAAVLAPSLAARPAWVPTGLDRAIAALPSGTVVCNDYGIGGWLLWAHPNVRPAIDGRIEVYSLSHVESYMKFHYAVPEWEAYLGETACRYAILPTDGSAYGALTGQQRWSVTTRSDGWALLRQP